MIWSARLAPPSVAGTRTRVRRGRREDRAEESLAGMSLVGNLEDLGLGDILQIVSLSRKSGVLYLRNEPEGDARQTEGEIIFQNGQVIRATSTEATQNLGDILLARGLITETQLDEALAVQRAGGGRERLGNVLIRLGVAPDKIQESIRKQTEAIVYAFFRWQRGDFSFELRESDGALDKVDLEMRHMVLDSGLNPQFLAMEGTRLKDESKRGQIDPASLPVAPRVAAAAAAAPPLTHAPTPEPPSERGEAAAASGPSDDPFADLGVDAGDLAEAPRPAPAAAPGDRPAASPSRADAPTSSADTPRRADAALNGGPRPRPRAEGPTIDLTRELGLGQAAPPFGGPSSRGLGMLRGMISELTNPEAHGQITLLILRFASELMRRAVLFLVKDDEVVGLGQFGIETEGENPDRVVRGIRIPRSEPSVFASVLKERVPYKGPLGDGRWDAHLVKELGGFRPAEAFCAPIASGPTIAALLYADNAPEEMPIGDTEALEIFLHQAGIQMEKALLERKIKELNRPGR
jgi:hypothetical protein